MRTEFICTIHWRIKESLQLYHFYEGCALLSHSYQVSELARLFVYNEAVFGHSERLM